MHGGELGRARLPKDQRMEGPGAGLLLQGAPGVCRPPWAPQKAQLAPNPGWSLNLRGVVQVSEGSVWEAQGGVPCELRRKPRKGHLGGPCWLEGAPLSPF